jgi:hypothetical protein
MTNKIYTEGSEIPYIFIDELPIEEQKAFEIWIDGSTAPLIEGQEDRSTAYVSDYRRWRSCYF